MYFKQMKQKITNTDSEFKFSEITSGSLKDSFIMYNIVNKKNYFQCLSYSENILLDKNIIILMSTFYSLDEQKEIFAALKIINKPKEYDSSNIYNNKSFKRLHSCLLPYHKIKLQISVLDDTDLDKLSSQYAMQKNFYDSLVSNNLIEKTNSNFSKIRYYDTHILNLLYNVLEIDILKNVLEGDISDEILRKTAKVFMDTNSKTSLRGYLKDRLVVHNELANNYYPLKKLQNDDYFDAEFIEISKKFLYDSRYKLIILSPIDNSLNSLKKYSYFCSKFTNMTSLSYSQSAYLLFNNNICIHDLETYELEVLISFLKHCNLDYYVEKVSSELDKDYDIQVIDTITSKHMNE